jgi:hypothetical protein
MQRIDLQLRRRLNQIIDLAMQVYADLKHAPELLNYEDVPSGLNCCAA